MRSGCSGERIRLGVPPPASRKVSETPVLAHGQGDEDEEDPGRPGQ